LVKFFMSKNSYLLPVLAVFFVLYFFLFPYPVKQEFVLVPERKIPLDPPGGDLSSLSGGIEFFRGESRMGYYDDSGRAVVLEGGGRSRISSRFFIEEEGGSLSLRSRSGQDSFPLDTSLTPSLFEDRLLLADAFQGYISETDRQGRILWDYHLPSLITCLDSRDGLTAVGLLNGEIRLFDGEGEPLFTWSPGGSRINAVYGIALAPGGESIALVSGLDPQRFILLEKKENGYRPVFHENLRDSSRESLFISIDESRNILLRGEGEGLFYAPNASSLHAFPLPGAFVDGETLPGEGTVYFVSGENGRAFLSLYTEGGDLILTNRYRDSASHLDIRGGKILLAGSKNAYLFGRGFY
jgi:hypothetical protein